MIPRLVLEKSFFNPEVAIIPIRPSLPEFRVAFCARTANLKAPVVEASWATIGTRVVRF